MFLLSAKHPADTDAVPLAVVGGRGLIYDIRDRAADRLCRYGTGMHPFSSLPNRIRRMNGTDVYRPEAAACYERCAGHFK